MNYQEQGLSYPQYRAVHAEWSELSRAVERAARRLRLLGEPAQAAALELDLAHLERRAQLHLRHVLAALEHDDLTRTRGPCEDQAGSTLTAVTTPP